MENNIGIGILVALTFTSTAFILKSEYFTKSQKVVLGILFLFPPAQWILALVLGIWNKSNNTTTGFKIDKVDNQINELLNLKNKGLLTESEYQLKSEQVKDKKEKLSIEQSQEYKTLEKLRDENILTDTEFKEKVELLKIKVQQSEETEIVEEDIELFEGNSFYILVIFIVAIIIAISIVLNR